MFKKMKSRDACEYLFCNIVLGVICCVSFFLAYKYDSWYFRRLGICMLGYMPLWNLFLMIKLIVKEKQADPQSAADN